jgi:hypothetical protein
MPMPRNDFTVKKKELMLFSTLRGCLLAYASDMHHKIATQG